MNLNKVQLIGRLTRDPELRSTTGGQSVASFGVATNRTWTDKNGAKQEDVQFHNVVVWGRQAEIVNQFLTKGALVYVEGRLQTRAWQGKDGANMKTTEVVAERVQFGPRAAGSSSPNQSNRSNPSNQSNNTPDSQEKPGDDLPSIDIDDSKEINSEDLPF